MKITADETLLINALKSLEFSGLQTLAHRETLRKRLQAVFRRACPPAALEDDDLLYVAAAGHEERCFCGAVYTYDETGRRVCPNGHTDT